MEIWTAVIAAIATLVVGTIGSWAARADSLELDRLTSARGRVADGTEAAINLDGAIASISARVRNNADRSRGFDRILGVVAGLGLAGSLALVFTMPLNVSNASAMDEYPVQFWSFALSLVAGTAAATVLWGKWVWKSR